MNRELLDQPFSLEQIKQRPGSFGNQLNYIEGHDVIKRLNDAFDGYWTFKIISHDIYEGEVVVLGELVAEKISKTQFGSSFITKAKDTGAVVSLGDDFKAAATDALKKAASLFGVGLHLYSKGDNGTASKSGDVASDKKYHGQSTNPAGTTQTRISSKQHQFLIKLGMERNWSKQDLNQRSIEVYGSGIAHLNKQQASEFIANLLDN